MTTDEEERWEWEGGSLAALNVSHQEFIGGDQLNTS